MSQFVSPGVYILERDFSDYVAALGQTAVGMVGTAKKGPLNEPTLCTTPEEFLNIFGEPDVNQYGPYAAINYLRRGNQLYYVRVAKEYALEVGVFLSYSYDSNTDTYTITLTSTTHGISVGDWIRIREAGKRTSYTLKVSSVTGAVLELDPTSNTRLLNIEDYTSTVAVIDLDDSTVGAAANNAEVFAVGRYDSTITDLVKFTARHSGAWANYGSSSGVEITISDGGAFKNIDPATGSPYEDDDGTVLEGVLPSSPSVDSPLDLFAMTSAETVSQQMRGVNKDWFNTPVVSISNSSGVALFEVDDASFFSKGDNVAINGTVINSSSTYDDTDLYVSSTNTTTDKIRLANLAGAINITSTSSNAGYTKLNVNVTSGVIATDIVLISGTDITGLDGIHTVNSVATGVINIDLAWDVDYASATGTLKFGPEVTYLTTPGTSDTLGYALNKSRPAPAGVYLCTSVSSTDSKWKKIGLHTKQVRVFYQGRQVEMYEAVSGHDNTSNYFWDTVIGNPSNPVSGYVYAEYLGSGDNLGAQPMSTYQKVKFPNNPRLLLGNTTYAKIANTANAAAQSLYNARGVDGSNPTADAYIGTITDGGVYTGIQNFRRVELWDINLLCVPGVTLSSVITEIIDVCDDRNDCLGLIDTPLGLSVQEAIDWHNGQGTYTGDHAAFATNRAAAYYPWVKQYDPYTRSDIWLPPTAIIPAVIAHSDFTSEVWYAPAGINRGTVPNARAVETVVSKGHIEQMYGPGNGNALNPIAQFPKDGIVVFGQRTLQRTPSSLDRVNVRRLLFYIEKTVASAARKLVFEQNDPILWAQFRNLVEPFFKDLRGRRALEWYRVICDESTNPASRRNNNEMAAKIYIIPVKTAEKIILDFTLLPSGANVEEFIAADLGEA